MKNKPIEKIICNKLLNILKRFTSIYVCLHNKDSIDYNIFYKKYNDDGLKKRIIENKSNYTRLKIFLQREQNYNKKMILLQYFDIHIVPCLLDINNYDHFHLKFDDYSISVLRLIAKHHIK
jgi:hypothetical protein